MTTYTLSGFYASGSTENSTPEIAEYRDFNIFIDSKETSLTLFESAAPGLSSNFFLSKSPSSRTELFDQTVPIFVDLFSLTTVAGSTTIFLLLDQFEISGDRNYLLSAIAGDPAPIFTDFDNLISIYTASEIDFFLDDDPLAGTFDLHQIPNVEIFEQDNVLGSNFSDEIFTGLGKDAVYGNDGNDTIRGGAGADELFGQLGADKLLGQRGADTLKGGRGNDTLLGGKGKDTLEGGKGNDSLTGGAGQDLFVFKTNNGEDSISDFEDNTDTLHLSSALWGGFGLSAQEIIDEYAEGFLEAGNGTIILDFDTTTIFISGMSDTSLLVNDISIF